MRIEGDRITAAGPSLDRRPGEEVLAAGGGSVIPGLHDHHIHLRALVAARTSTAAGPPSVHNPAELAAALADAAATAGPGGWVRAVGYHESVAGDLDRWVLDWIGPPAPVRVQHRSGALWVLNSAALAALRISREAPAGVERDAAGIPTGRVWRADRWLGERLAAVGAGPLTESADPAITSAGPPARSAAPPAGLAGLGASLAAWGVTGLTDATPDQTDGELADLAAAHADGTLPQRLHLMAPLGATDPAVDAVTIGPVKVLLDDTHLDRFDRLTDLVAAAHPGGRAVAVHCVTRVQAAFAVAAFAAAGAAGTAGARTADRIEHGAVLGADLIAEIARLGLIVVTQPGFVATRGDQYVHDVDPADRPDLWRLASLRRAGVPVALSTDAPFGSPDPWATVRAAVERRTASGVELGPAEAVTADDALALFAGTGAAPTARRTVAPGQPADLCVLATPIGEAVAEPPGRPTVLATIVGGAIVHRAG